MNTVIHPKDTEPHYWQGPHVLSGRLDKANDRGYFAHKTLGQLHEDLRKFRQRCETDKALAVAITIVRCCHHDCSLLPSRMTIVPLLGVGQHGF